MYYIVKPKLLGETSKSRNSASFAMNNLTKNKLKNKNCFQTNLTNLDGVYHSGLLKLENDISGRLNQLQHSRNKFFQEKKDLYKVQALKSREEINFLNTYTVNQPRKQNQYVYSDFDDFFKNHKKTKY